MRLALRPFEDVAWFWAAVVGAPGLGQPLVALRAHDLRIPASGTDVRGDGVWASLTCETPHEHWSVGLESFGVALDDPLEAWRDERGDVLPFGLELEWEATQPPTGHEGGYSQWCEVHGDVLLGDDRLEVHTIGSRDHAWGRPEDRPSWRAAIPGGDVRRGTNQLVTQWADDCLPTKATLDGLELHPTGVSPVLVPGAAVIHALCRRADKSAAEGWVTWWA